MRDARFPALRRDAVLCWNELLSSWSNPESVIAYLPHSQKDLELVIGERPFCTVARPRFVTPDEMTQEHRAVSVLSRTVREAVEGECIVQERIEVTREEYPLVEKGFALREFYVDTDPFHFPGGYAAVLTRISSAEITNVAQGGSIVPTFVIDAR